jgi:hypothetical protein
MMTDDLIHNRCKKKSNVFGEHKFEIIVICIAITLLAAELLFFINESYLEGRGVIPFGTWGEVVVASYLAAIFFCIVFVVLGIVKHRTYMFLLSIFSLIAFPAMFFVAVGISKPGYLKYTAGFRDRLTARCDAQEMRDWAQSFLKTHSVGYYTLTDQQVPNFIKIIYPYSHLSTTVNISVKETNNPSTSNSIYDVRYVLISWGRIGGIAIDSKELRGEQRT